MSSPKPESLETARGQEPEDVALDSLAEIWPIRDSITSPDEAAMFEAKVRPILTRLVRAGQRKELEDARAQLRERGDCLHEEMEIGQAAAIYGVILFLNARLALLREE